MVVVSPVEQSRLLSSGWKQDSVPVTPTIEVATLSVHAALKKSRMWAILMSAVFRPMQVSVQLSGTNSVKYRSSGAQIHLLVPVPGPGCPSMQPTPCGRGATR